MEALISAGNGSDEFLVRNFEIVITKQNALTHNAKFQKFMYQYLNTMNKSKI